MKNKRKLKRNKEIYREFPPVVMDLGGYISPTEETSFNIDTTAKEKNTYLTAGEEAGWAALDIIASPVGISGKPLSGYLTNKKSRVTKSKGSTFGTIEAQYMHPVAQEVLKAFPMTKPFAEAGQAIGNMASPMVNADDPNAVATRQMMTGIGGAATQAGMQINDAAQNWGAGKQSFNLGGQLPMNMNLNELNGPSHEEGGMSISPQVEVEGDETIFEPESYVFSDSLTVPGKKRTFAQESKSIRKKYDLRPEDKLSQNAMNKELESLMQTQEIVKQEAIASDINKFQETMHLKYGGKIEYDDGGFISPRKQARLDRRAARQQARLAKRAFKDQEYGNLTETDDQPVDGIYYTPVTDLPVLNENVSSPKLMNPEVPDLLTGKPENPYEGISVNNPGYFQPPVLNDKLLTNTPEIPPVPEVPEVPEDTPERRSDYNNMANNIAMATAGAKGLGKQRLLLTPKAKMNYINSRPAEILAEQQASQGIAAGLDSLRDSGMGAGQMIANANQLVGNINKNAAATVTDLRLKRDMGNIDIANNLALNNQAVSRENNALTTQYDSAQMLRRDKILDDFNRIGQSRVLDDKQKLRENKLIKALGKENFKYDSNGNLMTKTNGNKWVYVDELPE